MSTASLRALAGARVSHLTGPEKVSHEAQLETATNWVLAHGHRVIGTFEDLGVSASVRPDDRPDLGQWLTEEGADRWDVIVWSKMDRAFRSTRHCVDFARWAEEHRKVVVFAEDNLTLDYRPGAAKGLDAMMAEFFVIIGSFFAQLELNRFKTRAQDEHRVIRQTDRWAGGQPPLGFRIVDHPSGRGKGLATDPEGKALLHAMAEKLLDGWSFIRITAWLNDTAALTNKDRSRVRNGQAPRTHPWRVSTVIEALTSPRTQGLKIHKGKTVLDANGEPIRLAPPTFDADTWQRIRAATALRQVNQRTPTDSTNPMLGIGVCAKCQHPLAQHFVRRKTKTGITVHRYYRCGRRPINCNGISAKADDADKWLEHFFLYAHGDDPMIRRLFVAGEDHSHELEEINETIVRLHREQDSGLVRTEEDERVWTGRMRALLDRRDALSAIPHRAAGWVTEKTDRTYRDMWPDLSTAERHQLMIERGVRFVLESGRPQLIAHLIVPRLSSFWAVDED
jgi:site-specific DNA recombinase